MQTGIEGTIQVQGLVKEFKVSKRKNSESFSDESSSSQNTRGSAAGNSAGMITAVNGLSFTVRKGEIYGLLGPNGAGKTTTMRMLATLIKPTAGDAFVAGHSIVNDPEAVRSSIGFLTSELKLEDFFTPNYLYDFFSQLHHVEHSVAAERKQQLFQRFGIDEFANTKISKLSTGMKQKASIAISLVHVPNIIIFDEPTNGLDILTARVVTDYLEELRSQGKTIILSTHIFSLATKLCDRIGIIMDGQMIVEGTMEEIAPSGDLEDAFFDVYAMRHPEDYSLGRPEGRLA